MKNRANKLFRISFVGLTLTIGGLANTAFARGPDLPISFNSGAITIDTLVKGYDSESSADQGHSISLDFDINALGFAGEMTINGMWDSTTSDFKYRYGDRLTNKSLRNGGDNLEIYNFSATYLGESVDTNLFYHVPRYHWGYEGDYFGLMRETTNMPDQDIWNEKAPAGIELIGKGELDGFKLVAGDEIYWGADPMVMLKQQFGESDQYTFIASSEVSGVTKQRQFSLQGDFDLSDTATIKLGVLNAGEEHIGDVYYYELDSYVKTGNIDFRDTIALKARVTDNFSPSVQVYSEYNYAGLVADAGEHQEVWKTNIPYSSLGNKQTVEIGAQVTSGNWRITPRLFKRINLAQAMSDAAMQLGNNQSVYWRTTDSNHTGFVSPFAVRDNREAVSGELFFTYDPTPATFFYEWDNDVKEDAELAFNVGITRTDYSSKSDSAVWWDPQGWHWIDEGRPVADDVVTTISSKIVYNPSPSLRVVANLEAGQQVPVAYTAADAKLKKSNFNSISAKLVHNSQNIYKFTYAKNKMGEYDEDKNFGIRYPEHLEFSYERLLTSLGEGSKVGIQAYKRKMDDNSGADYASGANSSMYEVRAYFTYAF
ncbi:MAG: hypothetical protein QGG88_10500 [Gammaproteobacteria bacterium]|jgi:hypothetical protein|nr:hypothetical protein [Gammaproteobacteria bacterium]